MAKAFTTHHPICGKEPLHRLATCEVKYEDGQAYLDHCGRLLKKLIRHTPSWIVTTDPSPQGTVVFNVVTGLKFACSMVSASLTLDKTTGDEVIEPDEVNGFIDQADMVL